LLRQLQETHSCAQYELAARKLVSQKHFSKSKPKGAAFNFFESAPTRLSQAIEKSKLP
jgi:hypothetical protein